jgi:hypothetical protein
MLYHLSESNSIKFEINRNNPKKGSSETAYGIEWAFMMF